MTNDDEPLCDLITICYNDGMYLDDVQEWLHYFPLHMPFAYSKKNSYRRKTRSYKKFGTKRYSRKRVARSSGYR